MRVRNMLVLVMAFAASFVGCSSEKSATGKGTLQFVDDGDGVRLEIVDTTVTREDNVVIMRFNLTGDGEGNCKFEGFALGEEYGDYQLSAGWCEFMVDGVSWSASPAKGRIGYQEESIDLSGQGTLSKNARRGGPTYFVKYEGAH